MPRSMTGYGVGIASRNGHNIIVELRSVNNRFLDLNIKIPRALYPHEQDLRDLIRARLERGRVSILVKEEWDKNYSPNIRIDKGKARRYAEALEELRNGFGLGGEVRLEHLLAIGDLFSIDEDEAYSIQLWELTRDAGKQALDGLIAVSKREGENLVADLTKRIDFIKSEKENIRRMTEGQAIQYRDRLTQRLEELLGDNRIDPNRLETEIAFAADRLDISEELVRLESHIDLFQKNLNSSKSSGKTLGFILQEMGREANTIASKSWLVDISQAAIRIKETLEQVREQVQNLE